MTRLPAVFFVGAALLVTSAGACGDNSVPGPNSEPPTAPAQNDPAFTATGLRSWYLIGDGVTGGNDQLTMVIDAPAGSSYVDAWIGTLAPVRLQPQDGQFATQVSIADLVAGDYAILLAADGSDTAFASVPFHRSAPYYVMMSTDWDFSDPGDPSLADIDDMHAAHPGMLMTDFVGPYTFTDPAVTAERATAIATRLQGWRDNFGDELGLHIHPYCNFVTHAGLTCITDQSTVYAAGDTSGYTIEVGAYGRDEFGTLLDDAASLFEANGLGHPKTFRAGGWTATIDTVNALADHGYIADSSALNWARIDSWKGVGNGVLYNWNMENWAPIGDTSQPWKPNQDVLLDDNAPQLPILEVPVNGVMVDYVSAADMETIFNEIWTGGALTGPRMLMVGFHPSSTYQNTEGPERVMDILNYADQRLATSDLGPVVYTTLTAIVPVFSSIDSM